MLKILCNLFFFIFLVETTSSTLIERSQTLAKCIWSIEDAYKLDNREFIINPNMTSNTETTFIEIQKRFHPHILRTHDDTRDIKLKQFLTVIFIQSEWDSDYECFFNTQNKQTAIKRIAVIFTENSVPTIWKLKKIFTFFWNKFILNIVCIYFNDAQLKLFTYHPFGNFRILQVFPRQCFFDKLINLQKFQITIEINDNLPRITVNSAKKYDGRDGQMFNVIISKLNVTVNIINDEQHNGSEDKIALKMKTVMWTNVHEPLQLINIEKAFIVVPAVKPYPHFKHYFMAFSPFLWIWYLSLIATSLVVLTWIRKWKITISRMVIGLLQLTLNSSPDFQYKKFSRKELCIIIPWSLVGIVLGNTYLPALSSYMTKPVYQGSIKTTDDILRYNLRLAIKNSVSFKRLGILKLNLENITTSLDPDDFLMKLHAFDTSYCYWVLDDQASLIMERQKRLNKRVYSLIEAPIKRVFFTYISDAPQYTDKFNEIILNIYSSGLYYKWTEDESTKLSMQDLLQNNSFLVERNVQELAILHFLYWILLIGYSCACIVLVIEFLIHNLCKRKNFNKSH